MRVVVLQHADAEHPGYLRTLLARDGHSMEVVNLHRGAALPGLEGVDAVWAMGGPMDVWQEDLFPWLIAEKRFIREAVAERGIPFLGVCLGHQLLASALGGTVGKGGTEVGVLPVTLTEGGARSQFFDQIDSPLSALQWHGAEVKSVPEGARVLAASQVCPVQAFAWGPAALGVQFHVEIENSTVREWLEIPEYARALCDVMGPQGPDHLESACAVRMADLNRTAEQFYGNWVRAVEQPETR